MMLDKKPTSNQILKPTGTILEAAASPDDLEFYIGNLLTIYGVPNAMKISYVAGDFIKTSSFYSYLDLVKLTTNYGLAFSLTALQIGLGAAVSQELNKLELLYPAVNRAFGLDEPDLSLIKTINPFGIVEGLEEVLSWFGYDSLDVGTALADFDYFNQWLKEQEPRYSTLLIIPFDAAKYFNELIKLKAGFVITPELVSYLKKAYY
jgi:hypothetical protein